MNELTRLQRAVDTQTEQLDKKFREYYNRFMKRNPFLKEEQVIIHFKKLVQRVYENQFSRNERTKRQENRNEFLHALMLEYHLASAMYTEKQEALFLRKDLPRIVLKYRNNKKKDKPVFKKNAINWSQSEFFHWVCILKSTSKINKIHYSEFSKEYLSRSFKPKEKASRHKLNKVSLDKYLNISEASNFLKIEKGTLYNWVSKGKIASNKIGGRLLFDRAELERWVEKN